MRAPPSTIIPAIFLILFGAWLLADNLSVPVPGLDQLWPGSLVVFGLGFLAQYVLSGRRDDGLVFVGTAGTLLGAFFLAITLGPLEWGDLGRWWPVFVLIGGVTFLAQWLVRPAERALLVPAVLGLLVGAVALAFTFDRVGPALTAQVARLWPLALVLAGLLLVGSYFLRPDRRG